MVKQFYSLQGMKVAIERDEWEKVRRRLIERIPLYSKKPDLYAEVRFGKKSKKTSIIRDNLAPDWQESLEIDISDENENVVIEVVHSTLLNLRNPRIGQFKLTSSDLLSEDQEREISGDLRSLQDSGLVGKISLRLSHISVEQALEGADFSVSKLHHTEESGIYDAIGELLELIGPFMDGIDKFSEIYLYLNSGWKILSFLHKIVDKQYKTDSRMIDLVKEMSLAFSCVKDLELLSSKNKSLEEAIVLLSCQITECCLFIREYLGHGFLRRMISSNRQNKVADFMKSFVGMKEHFHLALSTQAVYESSDMHLKLDYAISRLQMNINLQSVEDRLKPETQSGTPHATCLPGTRIDMIKQIIDLLMSTEYNVIWLNGPAGCGKSTIALTIAEHFVKLSRLGGYVFFTRGKSQPDLVIRTIAHKLASIDPSVAEHILNSDPNYVTLSLQVQFEQLLLAPLQKAAEKFDGPIVIILDALDECGDKNTRKDLLRLFENRSILNLPKNIRILVTSRREDDIERTMTSNKIFESVKSIVLDPRGEESQRDVPLYIRYSLLSNNEIAIEKNSSLETDMDVVAKAAQGLFIWASTFVKLVISDIRPLKKFKETVDQIRSKSSLFGLEDIYNTIFSGCGLSKNDKNDLDRILSVVLLNRKPVSAGAIDRLLGLDKGDTRRFLSKLQSVVFCDEGNPICFFHASFPEYLTDKARSGRYFVNTSEYKSFISLKCFSVMFSDEGLRVNICELQSSLTKYETIPKLRMFLSEQLECACVLWSCVCDQETTDLTLISTFKRFTEGYLLQWFEVLSLTKNLHLASPILLSAIGWASKYVEEYTPMLKEARRLVNKYYIPIFESAPHVYLSLIPFEKDSIIVENYRRLVTPIVEVEENGAKFPSFLNTWIAHQSEINRIIITPDGNHIISCDSKELKIWDAHSTMLSMPAIRTDEGFRLKDLTLSSNGDKLVMVLYSCYNLDGSFVICDTKLWKPLVQPTRTIKCGILASSFIQIGESETLGLCSKDGTVSLWDPSSGSLKREFSLDSKGGFTERELRPRAGDFRSRWRHISEDMSCVSILNEEGRKFRDEISCASFSPTGCRIAYFYETSKILILNWMDHQIVYKSETCSYKGARKWIGFSADGTIIFIRNEESEIVLRDAMTGDIIRKTRIGTGFTHFAMSHDKKYLVAAHNDIFVWEVQSGDISLVFEQSGRRIDDNKATSVEFSPDGSRIVTGRRNGIIETYDTEIKIERPLQELGNIDLIFHSRTPPAEVAFSEDGGVVSLWRRPESYTPYTASLLKWDKDYKQVDGFGAEAGRTTLITFGGRRIRFPRSFFGCKLPVVSDFAPDNSCKDDLSLGIMNVNTGQYTTQYIQKLLRSKTYDCFSAYNGQVIATLSPKLFELFISGPEGGYYKDTISLSDLPQHPRYIAAISFDSSHVALQCEHSTIIIDTVKGGHSLDLHKTLGSAEFSPCGLFLAGCDHSSVLIYGTGDGQLAFGLQGHIESVSSIIYSPDGSCLASGSSNGMIIVWDIATRGIILGPIQGHCEGILAVSVSNDNSRLASASKDCSIKIWDLTPNGSQTQHSMNIGYMYPHSLHTWAREFTSKVNKFSTWAVEDDGWIRDNQGQLLVWVPADVRSALRLRRNLAVMSCFYNVALKFRCD